MRWSRLFARTNESMNRAITAFFLGLALAGCRDTREAETPRTATIDSAAVPPPKPYRPGIHFDPQEIRPGTPVGALVADSVTAQRAMVDSTLVGIARFRGSIQLSGWTLRHPETDLTEVASCFEADSASASRLPRWNGDDRRAWFCFVNRADAKLALGPPSEGAPVAIVIDSFTIHRGLSDEVNSARFVRRVRDNPE
jgi:hypothetical protein